MCPVIARDARPPAQVRPGGMEESAMQRRPVFVVVLGLFAGCAADRARTAVPPPDAGTPVTLSLTRIELGHWPQEESRAFVSLTNTTGRDIRVDPSGIALASNLRETRLTSGGEPYRIEWTHVRSISPVLPESHFLRVPAHATVPLRIDLLDGVNDVSPPVTGVLSATGSGHGQIRVVRGGRSSAEELPVTWRGPVLVAVRGCGIPFALEFRNEGMVPVWIELTVPSVTGPDREAVIEIPPLSAAPRHFEGVPREDWPTIRACGPDGRWQAVELVRPRISEIEFSRNQRVSLRATDAAPVQCAVERVSMP